MTKGEQKLFKKNNIVNPSSMEDLYVDEMYRPSIFH